MINLSSFLHASDKVDNEPNMATRNNGTWEVSEPIYPKSARYNITEIFKGHCLHWDTTMKWLLQGSTPLGFLHIAKKKWLHILQWESPLCAVVLGGKKEREKKERDGPLLTWAPSSITHRNVELLPRLGKKSTSLKGDRMSAWKKVQIEKCFRFQTKCLVGKKGGVV